MGMALKSHKNQMKIRVIDEEKESKSRDVKSFPALQIQGKKLFAKKIWREKFSDFQEIPQMLKAILTFLRKKITFLDHFFHLS